MSKKYRLGVIGFAHMHILTLMENFAELPNVEWVACADTKPDTPTISREWGTRGDNLKVALDKIGVPKSYDDYKEMLAQEEFDIIIVCSENAKHSEVVQEIARAGVHAVVEKPMATTYHDALLMARAAQNNNVKLAINWPSTWRAANRLATELIADGAIGDVWKFKYANFASRGPLEYGQTLTGEEKAAEWWHQKNTGGGAFLDYCCYGACLSRWFIGQPAVGAYGLQANFASHYGDADDNGLVMVKFPNSVAVLEGSWSTSHFGVPNGPIVYGTTGTLVCERNTVTIYRGFRDEPIVHEAEPLPEHRNNVAKEFMHHLETGEPLHPTLDMEINLDAMAILDAGLRSASSAQFELAKDEIWG